MSSSTEHRGVPCGVKTHGGRRATIAQSDLDHDRAGVAHLRHASPFRVSSCWRLVVLVVVPAVGGAATTPARRCASAKLKAAGSTASGLLGCHASAVKRGAAVDPTCLGKAHAKLTSAFSRAEAKGGCASGGDAGTVTTTLDGFVDGVAAALADGGTSDGRRCAAVKLKAAGKKASTKLGCHARAVTKLAVADPTVSPRPRPSSRAPSSAPTGATSARPKATPRPSRTGTSTRLVADVVAAVPRRPTASWC